MQARLTDVLGLHHTTSRVSIDSIASFSTNPNTKEAFKKFCKNLHQIGVTAEIISQKESEILNILKAPNPTNGGQIDASASANQSRLPPVSNFPSVIIYIY